MRLLPQSAAFPSALAVLVLVTCVLAWKAGARLKPEALAGDEPDYHEIAVRVVEHGSLGTASRFPAYPLLVAAVYRLCGVSPAAMRVPHSLLAGALVAFAGVLAFRAVQSVPWACAAVLLLLGDGYVFAFAGQLLTECLFTAVVLGAVVVLGRGAEGGAGRVAAAKSALLLACSVLIRGQGVFFAAAAGGLAVVVRDRFLPHWRLFAGTLGAGVLLLVLGWNLYVHATLGRWPGLTTGTGWVLYGAHCPEAYERAPWMGRWVLPGDAPSVASLSLTGDEWSDNRVLTRAAVQSALRQPLAMNVKLYASKLFHALYPSPWVTRATALPWRVGGILLAWATIGGFLLCLCACVATQGKLALSFYAGTLACVLLFYGDKRILFPVFPLICIDSVVGWRWAVARLREHHFPRLRERCRALRGV